MASEESERPPIHKRVRQLQAKAHHVVSGPPCLSNPTSYGSKRRGFRQAAAGHRELPKARPSERGKRGGVRHPLPALLLKPVGSGPCQAEGCLGVILLQGGSKLSNDPLQRPYKGKERSSSEIGAETVVEVGTVALGNSTHVSSLQLQ